MPRSAAPSAAFPPAGALAAAQYQTLPVFNLQVPTACPGVPPELLLPSRTWRDPQAYEQQLRHLAQLCVANFEKFLVGAGIRFVLVCCSLGRARRAGCVGSLPSTRCRQPFPLLCNVPSAPQDGGGYVSPEVARSIAAAGPSP